jgi:tetratricopeptide (TPR) repeat protein
MSGDKHAFENAMNLGHSAAWDQEWEKAALFYRTAIAEFPDNYVALSSLALALFEIQNYQDSLKYYRLAAQQSPEDPVPVQKIAEIYEHSGDFTNASKAFMDVAELYARKKDVENAIHNWARVVALNPDHLAAHTRLALVYERLNRTSEAMVEYIAIASLLQSQGNVPKAVQTMKHALQVVPNSKEASLALSMLQSGKPLPRATQLQSVGNQVSISKTPTTDSMQVKDDIYPRLDPIQDAKQKALTLLAEVLFEQEEAHGPQSRKGLASIVKGNTDSGQGTFDQAKVIHHLSQAIDLQSRGDELRAAAELEHAMAAGLDSSAAYFDLGFIQSKCEQYESVVEN